MMFVYVFCSFRSVLSPWNVVEASPLARPKTTPTARIVVEVFFAVSFHTWALPGPFGMVVGFDLTMFLQCFSFKHASRSHAKTGYALHMLWEWIAATVQAIRWPLAVELAEQRRPGCRHLSHICMNYTARLSAELTALQFGVIPVCSLPAPHPKCFAQCFCVPVAYFNEVNHYGWVGAWDRCRDRLRRPCRLPYLRDHRLLQCARHGCRHPFHCFVMLELQC